MQRRSCTAEEKTKLVLKLIRGEHELNEIAIRESLAPNQLRNWKNEFLDNATLAFDKKRDQRLRDGLMENSRRQIDLPKDRTAEQ